MGEDWWAKDRRGKYRSPLNYIGCLPVTRNKTMNVYNTFFVLIKHVLYFDLKLKSYF